MLVMASLVHSGHSGSSRQFERLVTRLGIAATRTWLKEFILIIYFILLYLLLLLLFLNDKIDHF